MPPLSLLAEALTALLPLAITGEERGSEGSCKKGLALDPLYPVVSPPSRSPTALPFSSSLYKARPLSVPQSAREPEPKSRGGRKGDMLSRIFRADLPRNPLLLTIVRQGIRVGSLPRTCSVLVREAFLQGLARPVSMPLLTSHSRVIENSRFAEADADLGLGFRTCVMHPAASFD